MNSLLLKHALDPCIHDIAISDHTLISVNLTGLVTQGSVRIWHFPTYLAHDKDLQQIIDATWNEYTYTNSEHCITIRPRPHRRISSLVFWHTLDTAKSPISLEIIHAIKSLSWANTRHTPRVYIWSLLTFSWNHSPHFDLVYQKILDGNQYLPSGLQAHIKLIPKKGKNLTDPGSYCPISLLNLDSKLLSKIISEQACTHHAPSYPPFRSTFHPREVRHIQYPKSTDSARNG